jgi:hypothetical protein
VAIVAHVPARRGNGIAVLAGRDVTFGIAVNWSDTTRTYGGATWTGTRNQNVPAFSVAPRDARIVVLSGKSRPVPALPPLPQPPHTPPLVPWIDLNAQQAVHLEMPAVPAGTARAWIGAGFGSGDTTVTLANVRVVAVIVPNGGARLVAFAERGQPGYNATNATGALRDDVLIEPPASTTDRIAKYTHSYPAGTYNRPYRVQLVRAAGTEAVVRFRYDAPDLAGGAHFEKTVRLAADGARLVVDERVWFDGKEPAQRAVTFSALNVAADAFAELSPTFVTTSDHYHALAVTWNPAAVDRSTWTRYGSNGTLTLVAASDSLRTTYALTNRVGLQAARALGQEERDWLAANPNPP